MCLRALALALLLSGCVVPESAVAPPASVGPDATAARVLADSLDAAPSSAARRAVAVRALRRAGVTPLAGDRFTIGVRAPLVGGFVPGRAPGRSSELVVIGANLDRPGAADVLDVARVLVGLSVVGTTPERTVEVVFWSGPSTDAEGLAAAVRAPVWPRANVAAAVVVGGGAAVDSLGGVAISRVAPGRPADLLRTVLAHTDPPALPARPAP